MAKRKKKSPALPILLVLLIIALAVVIFIYTPVTDPRTIASGEAMDLELLALPVNDGDLIVHTGYTLKYSEEHEQPYWVAYVLTPQETVTKAVSRKDNFRADPSVPTGSAELSDYRSSGYDRGHLAPFADLSWSEESASDSFYLSNMSPQAGSFNRGRWADLESVVRTFSLSGPVCIVTGPVLTDGPYETIGKNRVSVPKYFYKAILFYDGPESRAIAFLMPNEACKDSLQSYAVSVDYIEDITELDFFSLLPDDLEDRVEASFDVSFWDFMPYSDKLAGSYGIPASSFEYYQEPQTLEEQLKYFLYINFSDIKIAITGLFGYSVEQIAALAHR